jgi:hypothetical protein
MSILTAATIVASVVFGYACVAFAQSPLQVDYCRALVGTYRKAVSDGAEPQPQLGEAIANCPTNPMSSIPVLEKGLKEMKVALPPR